MYFPQQPGVGGRMYSAEIDPARPPFGQDWANYGWNGAPRPENIQFDPNQPVPQAPRPNQPNNAGTMPGAIPPSAGTAAQQIQAWREANQGIHKQRWGGMKKQRPQVPSQAPPPTSRPPVPGPVPGPVQTGSGTAQGAAAPPPGPTTRPPVQVIPPTSPGGSGAVQGTPAYPVGPSTRPPVATQLAAMTPWGKDRQL